MRANYTPRDSYRPAFRLTGIECWFRAQPPANPARDTAPHEVKPHGARYHIIPSRKAPVPRICNEISGVTERPGACVLENPAQSGANVPGGQGSEGGAYIGRGRDSLERTRYGSASGHRIGRLIQASIGWAPTDSRAINGHMETKV
jgi:hypothetical protein